MATITFMGAGSTVFARNVLGDCMCREALKDSEIALYDIDAARLKESEKILGVLNANINGGVFMKVVLVKSPKLLGGILRMFFKIKKQPTQN